MLAFIIAALMQRKKLESTHSAKTVRLNKYLAQLGVASRRKIDQLIDRNQVWVNGRRASLGYKIDPTTDVIRIGKKEITPEKTRRTLEYWAVNKPPGYVSTTSDPDGRKTVVTLVKSRERLFPVGRLDADSEGLMILTNDGELTQKITHPKHHIPKTYRVWVRGQITSRGLDRIRTGVKFKHERVAPADVLVLEESDTSALLEITLYQGLHRQVRRMMASLNLEVTRLQRVAIGPIKLGDLKLGDAQALTTAEVLQLEQA
jgi:pseudouridine synthase